MKVVLHLETRNMLPDLLNHIAHEQGQSRSFAQPAEIHLMLERSWDSVPRIGEGLVVHDQAGPRQVEQVWWQLDGSVDVFLSELDTDEIAGDEGLVIEELFQAGWLIDWEMMPRL